MNYAIESSSVVSREDGVKDLPVKPRLFFAKALIAEAKGDAEQAEKYLEQAVAATQLP
jgi:hypothetical protein